MSGKLTRLGGRTVILFVSVVLPLSVYLGCMSQEAGQPIYVIVGQDEVRIFRPGITLLDGDESAPNSGVGALIASEISERSGAGRDSEVTLVAADQRWGVVREALLAIRQTGVQTFRLGLADSELPSCGLLHCDVPGDSTFESLFEVRYSDYPFVGEQPRYTFELAGESGHFTDDPEGGTGRFPLPSHVRSKSYSSKSKDACESFWPVDPFGLRTLLADYEIANPNIRKLVFRAEDEVGFARLVSAVESVRSLRSGKAVGPRAKDCGELGGIESRYLYLESDLTLELNPSNEINGR